MRLCEVGGADVPDNIETVGASNFAVWNHVWTTHWTIEASLSYIPDMFAYNNTGIRMAQVSAAREGVGTKIGLHGFAIWDTMNGAAWWIRSESHTRCICIRI